MQLSVPTLVVMTIVVAFTTSILLALSWLQNQSARCLFYWSVSNLIGTAVGILMMRRGVWPHFLTLHLANVLLFVGAGIAWAGMRKFGGKTFSWRLILAIPALWIVLSLAFQFERSIIARTVFSASVLAGYSGAMIWELWSGRREKLMSRWPAIIVFAAHAISHLARIPASFAIPIVDDRNVFASPIISFVAFETLIFVIASSFLRIALVKERAESRNKLAAETDDLTGVFNRRAFFDRGEQAMSKAEAEKANCAVVLIDLDHFKHINDRYGHAVGDRVLKDFAEIAQEALGNNGLFARLGGEEFGAILVGLAPEDAFMLTESLREIIAALPIEIAGYEHLSISAGVAFSSTMGYRLDELMKLADDALYCAKRNGRNRVECAAPPQPAASAQLAA